MTTKTNQSKCAVTLWEWLDGGIGTAKEYWESYLTNRAYTKLRKYVRLKRSLESYEKLIKKEFSDFFMHRGAKSVLNLSKCEENGLIAKMVANGDFDCLKIDTKNAKKWGYLTDADFNKIDVNKVVGLDLMEKFMIEEDERREAEKKRKQAFKKSLGKK